MPVAVLFQTCAVFLPECVVIHFDTLFKFPAQFDLMFLCNTQLRRPSRVRRRNIAVRLPSVIGDASREVVWLCGGRCLWLLHPQALVRRLSAGVCRQRRKSPYTSKLPASSRKDKDHAPSSTQLSLRLSHKLMPSERVRQDQIGSGSSSHLVQDI